MKNIFLLSVAGLVLFSSCTESEMLVDNSVVQAVDINRYLGTWYEIARYDNTFEKGLVGNTAQYSLREDGKIKVVNSGYADTLDGEVSTAVGKAKMPNPKEPAKLKVSFFLFFYGDYYILELDTDYQWAVVGSSTDKYLWILSRTPKMDDRLYRTILGLLEKRKYDTSKLLKVPQK